MKKKIRVGIHVNEFPIPSESFVIEQARPPTRFSPVMFVRRLNSLVENIECHAIQVGTRDWRRKAFAVWPGAWAWDKAAFHDVQLIHAHFGPNGVYALPLAKAKKIPLVVTFHGSDATVRPQSFIKDGGVLGIRYILGFNNLKNNATRIIAVSKFIENRLLTMGFHQSKIRQHYIGVDSTRFRPVGDEKKTLDVVCVGRLVEAKGISVLINAFSKISTKFPESKLRLIGEGRDRQKFEKLVEILRITDRVIFEGTMSHKNVAEIVSHSAVNVLVSKTGENGSQEAFGLASIEAAAAGVPSIVSRIGGLPETIEDGVTGLIVEENNVDELVDALFILLSDGNMRTRLGLAGRERVLRDFDIKTQTTKLENIYFEALDS